MVPKTGIIIRGTGLLLQLKKRNATKYVFPIANEKYWKTKNGKMIIEFAGVGGKPKGKETLLEAVLREALEETGCEAKLRHSFKTVTLDFQRGETFRRTLKANPAPFLKTKKLIQTDSGPRLLYNPIWAGSLAGKPKPSAEVPALLFLTDDLVAQTAKKDIRLKDILKLGGELIEARHIPRNAVIKPFGTPEDVVKAFGEKFGNKIRKLVSS